MTYAEAKREWNEAVENATDEDLIKYGIGCRNSTEELPYGEATCKYFEGGRCKKGAVLTSTLSGAYPNDCPIRNEAVDDNYASEWEDK